MKRSKFHGRMMDAANPNIVNFAKSAGDTAVGLAKQGGKWLYDNGKTWAEGAGSAAVGAGVTKGIAALRSGSSITEAVSEGANAATGSVTQSVTSGIEKVRGLAEEGESLLSRFTGGSEAAEGAEAGVEGLEAGAEGLSAVSEIAEAGTFIGELGATAAGAGEAALAAEATVATVGAIAAEGALAAAATVAAPVVAVGLAAAAVGYGIYEAYEWFKGP